MCCTRVYGRGLQGDYSKLMLIISFYAVAYT